MIDTCFGTHHLQFAEDANNTLYFSGSGAVVAWFNTKLFDETKDEQKAQGWAAYVIDTNGNGKRDAYVEPNQPTDPTKDKRFQGGSYGVIVSPVDGSVWQSFPGAIYLSEGNLNGPPGAITRTVLGSNPPQTTLTEYYEPPFNNPKSPVNGYTPRGIDIDRNGVVWTALAGSGHLASFDRRKCKGPLNGPTATGQHCPEGWTLHVTPGPKFKGVTDESNTDMLYYNWVDQFDTLGLGRNVPVRHRLVLRCADSLLRGEVRRHARAVSHGVLPPRGGRPDRRSEGGLERQRALGELRRLHPLALRRRQRPDEQGRAFPASARPARKVS